MISTWFQLKRKAFAVNRLLFKWMQTRRGKVLNLVYRMRKGGAR